MPLTAAEQAEMKSLEAELAPKKGGLTASEQAEMAQLEKELGGGQNAPQAVPQAAPVATSAPSGVPGSSTAQTLGEGAKGSEAGSFFAPAEVADRAKEGLIGSIPFAPAARDVLAGKAPYEASPEGVGRAFGDVGGTAAAIASGGLLPLAKFAGAGAALNALGIPQGAARIGESLEDMGTAKKMAGQGLVPTIFNKAEQVRSGQLPSKVGGIEGLGTALNFLLRTPGALASTAVQAAPYALAGKAVAGEHAPATESAPIEMPARPQIEANTPPADTLPNTALTDAQASAKALQDKGYPVTQSHITGDTALKAATTNKDVAEAADLYKKKLSAASHADVASALDTGGQTTQQLGETLGTSYGKALGARSAAYKNMLGMADNPAGAVNTGIGQFTHAGQAFAKGVASDLAGKGLKLNTVLDKDTGMTVQSKALTGGGLTAYDVPAGVNPDEATAAIKFADLASKKAASPVELDSLAKNFSKTEKLFQPGQGGASGGGFLRQVQNQATDLAAEILKKRDAQIGPAGGKPTYPEWAAQRANWAKSADLVDQFEGKLSAPKTRLTGENMYSASKLSPEQIFQKEFANAGADKVSAFKDFLKNNGQDPAILEHMGKDWLADKMNMASKDNPLAGVNAVEAAWRKMSPEYKSAVFSPETIVKVEDALARTRQARAPLEVMGTKMSGESPTQARTALQAAKPLGKAAAGAGIGAMLGGPVGAMGGGLAGQAMELIGRNAARTKALKALESVGPIEPTPAPGPGVLGTLSNKAAQIDQAMNRPIPGTPKAPGGIPALVLAAMAAQRNAQAQGAR